LARIFEYQGKEILKKEGIPIPQGKPASSPAEAKKIHEELKKPAVLKIQIWKTGRAQMGGIRFSNTPDETERISKELLGQRVGNFSVEKILVEERIDIDREFFAGVVIDDREKAPVILFSSVGGTGIEEIAKKYPEKLVKRKIDINRGFPEHDARNLVRKLGFHGKTLLKLGKILSLLYKTARKYDARSLEINPLVITKDGDIIALDCHTVIDDYAVYRHPELNIEVAREFDRPPTELEKIAYKVEANDYRGTFYFFQMIEKIKRDERAIGFHGAGGGGSMMSMDALTKRGFKLANFCDTSGNPPASKVYRACKIILSQPNILGYFASGSGVASQEQYHSARGFVKAFLEEEIEIPAVIRLGGNYEELAIEILSKYLKGIPGKVEGYGRDDSPDFCAERLEKLIEENEWRPHKVRPIRDYTPPPDVYSFETLTGTIYIDHNKCLGCEKKGCVDSCIQNILELREGKVFLSIDPSDAKKGKCTECLACEIECKFNGKGGIYIHLPIPGLKEYRESIGSE
jgi:succinyl-CoA synthetase beta subunit